VLDIVQQLNWKTLSSVFILKHCFFKGEGDEKCGLTISEQNDEESHPWQEQKINRITKAGKIKK